MANSRTPPGTNPRDKRTNERRSFGARRPAGVWYVVALLLLMVVAQSYFFPAGGRRLTYSEFKQAVRSGQVAEVVIGDQTIRGKYKAPVEKIGLAA